MKRILDIVLTSFGPARTDAPERVAASRWILLALPMAASAVAAVLLGQDASWDLQNYHYYCGYALLHKPFNYDFAPAQLQSFFNPLLFALPYLMLAHLPTRITAVALGAFQGINFYLLFLISQALFRHWRNPYRYLISLCNACTGFYGAINISELGTTFGDNLVSVLVLSGLLLIFRFLLSDGFKTWKSAGLLWTAGLSLGAAAGLKLTMGTIVAAAAVALTGRLLARADRARALSAFIGALAVGFIAVYGFWGANLYLRYGNPFYPHFNKLFHSPYYARTSTFDDRFMPRNLWQTLFYPFSFAVKNHHVSELDLRDARLALCYAAIVLLAGLSLYGFIKRAGRVREGATLEKDHPCLWFVAAVLVLAYGMWQYFFSIYRYAIVLEFLAPAFLALAVNRFLRKEPHAAALALALNLGICISVIHPDWGRKKFDDEFLKVSFAPIRHLDRSIVFMAGDGGTSYIVPSFPDTTRFMRIYSNFYHPGQNENLDRMIRQVLAKYDAAHTLVYVANRAELDHTRHAASFYGVQTDDTACFEVTSGADNRGYLCRAAGGWEADERKPQAVAWERPEFQELAGVRLEVTPSEPRAGRDTVRYHLIGLTARYLDLLYTIEDDPMPPVRGLPLDDNQSAQVFVAGLTRKGMYHIVGIRASGSADPDKWVRVDTIMRVR